MPEEAQDLCQILMGLLLALALALLLGMGLGLVIQATAMLATDRGRLAWVHWVDTHEGEEEEIDIHVLAWRLRALT
jgi:Na+(H+)/acetate symporter ActP